MIEIKLHTPIAPECENWCYALDGENGVFSLDFVQRLFAEHTDEKDFRFNIHCVGGVVSEGLAIYDFLRTSGKNIYTNIEGACHSMAVTILLAAPKENRTANRYAEALIHKVYTGYADGTADDLEGYAEEMRRQQDAILDIYADRTNLSREEAERIMNEEKVHTAEELLEWGFIAKINPYNTNIKTKTKKTMTGLLEKISNCLTSIREALNEQAEVFNYTFYGEDGVVLFRTERDDDYLEEGMKAEPDGVFEIGDRVIVIEGGVITEIRNEPAEEPRDEELNALREELEAMRAERDTQTAEIANLRTELANARDLLNEARAQIKSNGKIGNRIGSPQTPKPEPTREERLEEIKGKLKKKK